MRQPEQGLAALALRVHHYRCRHLTGKRHYWRYLQRLSLFRHWHRHWPYCRLQRRLQLQPWQIQLTILIVISVFIPVVCGTLYAVHAIFDHADDDIRPVAQQLTEELTGIAYLTVVVFCTQTFIHNLSMQIFGDTPAGKSFLGDLLDNTSNMMTLIAGVNIIQVYPSPVCSVS